MVVSTPVLELEADVLERMQDYVAQLAAGFERITRHYWAGVYLHGLLLDGERKSIQPLAERVTVPGWHGDTMQALQHFISDSTWDEQAVLQVYRRLLAASLAEGRSMDEAVRRAVAAGSMATRARGARAGLPTREELEAFLAERV